MWFHNVHFFLIMSITDILYQDKMCISYKDVVLLHINLIALLQGIANRVSLGLLPTSEGSWATAVRALR